LFFVQASSRVQLSLSAAVMSVEKRQAYPSLLAQRQPEGTGQKLASGKKGKLRASAAPRAAVCAVSLKGHLRLAKAVATELLGRGFVVDFLIGKAAEDLLELDKLHDAFNLHVVKEGAEMIGQFDWQTVASSSGRFGGSKVALMEEIAKWNTADHVDMCVKQWREFLRILESSRPDIVICDHAMQPFQRWAENNDIPSIILHTPYFTTGKPGKTAKMTAWQSFQLVQVMRSKSPLELLTKTSEALGIENKLDKTKLPEGAQAASKASGVSPHTLVFCEPELLNCSVKDLPGRVHAVGPCLSADVGPVDEDLKPWLDEAAENGERVLYIALGTLGNGFLNERAVQQMISAFKELGTAWRVLWSLPEEQQHLVKGLQDSQVRIASFVRQRAVLAHPSVCAFLSHGGQSSANESIFAGVPLVVMPLFCDQFEVADAIERHGLGLVFHKDELLSFWRGGGHRLATLVKSVAENANFRSSITRHQHLMQLRSDSHRAAEVVESIVQGGADYLELWQPASQATSGCTAGIWKCFEGLCKA